MIWLILMVAVAVLLFVLLYKRPVNAPAWTPPVAPSEPSTDSAQPSIQTFNFNDIYSGANKTPQAAMPPPPMPPMPPIPAPPKSGDQAHL